MKNLNLNLNTAIKTILVMISILIVALAIWSVESASIKPPEEVISNFSGTLAETPDYIVLYSAAQKDEMNYSIITKKTNDTTQLTMGTKEIRLKTFISKKRTPIMVVIKNSETQVFINGKLEDNPERIKSAKKLIGIWSNIVSASIEYCSTMQLP